MTEWYYTDSRQQRHGPVTADDLIALHNRNLLTGDTLVWRDGMSGWKAWRDVAAEVLGPASPEAPQIVDDGAYRPYAVAMPAPRPSPAQTANNGAPNASPYAAPRSRLESTRAGSGYVVYAGFWKRFAAYSIDGFLVGIVGAVLAVMLGILPAIGRHATTALPRDNGSIEMLSFLLGICYFSFMHARFGATLGKMAVGIKVVRSDGEHISLPLAIGRYFAWMLSYVILLIGLIMTAFTERKRALHDMICDTVVVDRYAFTDQDDQQNESLGAVTIIVIALNVLACGGVFAMGMIAATALSRLAH